MPRQKLVVSIITLFSVTGGAIGLFVLAALAWALPVLAARPGAAAALRSVGARVAVGVLAVAILVVIKTVVDVVTTRRVLSR